MRKISVFITALMISLVILGCGKAKEAAKATGFAEATYSATMTTASEGVPQPVEAKFYRDGDMMRHETKTAGFTMINITRKDKKLMWAIIPENKAYVEQPLTEEQVKKSVLYQEGQMVKIGEETVDGHPCVKYEVTTAQQPEVKNLHWLAKDLRNFPIRMENQYKDPRGKVTKSVVQFKDISFNKPAAELFEVPKDCKKVSSMAEAMMGAKMRGMPKGLAPMKKKRT